jgi:hypothetical protein
MELASVHHEIKGIAIPEQLVDDADVLDIRDVYIGGAVQDQQRSFDVTDTIDDRGILVQLRVRRRRPHP